MRLAFLLFKYFPHGGLQRNFRRITELCLEHGHSVDVYTLDWEGWTPDDPELSIEVPKVSGWRNHTRYRNFADEVLPRVNAGTYDRVVGFNKMPGLDVYYNADPCFMERAMKRNPVYRLSGRFRQHAAFERAVFAADARNHVLLLSEVEKPLFQRWYGTPADRFRLMPPYVSEDRFAPDDPGPVRAELRRELGLADDDIMLLMVGSDFKRKGVDRALRAIGMLADRLRARTHLYVLGKGRERPLRALARKLGIDARVHFMQGRDDVPRFLFTADLLLHTAYQENTGTAIVEAIAAALPALVTGNCGYAHYVEAAGSGRVLPEPFSQQALSRTLEEMLRDPDPDRWRDNARAYATCNELGKRAEHAVAVIEGPKYGEHA